MSSNCDVDITEHSIDTEDFRLFPLLVDILFGVVWKETGVKKFYLRNRQRVMSFAVTIVFKKYDPRYVTVSLMRRSSLSPYVSFKNKKKLLYMFFRGRCRFRDLLCLVEHIIHPTDWGTNYSCKTAFIHSGSSHARSSFYPDLTLTYP